MRIVAVLMLALVLGAGATAPTPRVVARVATGQAPCGAAAGFGSIWVANDGAGTVVAVDPARNRVVRTVRVGRTVCGIAIGAGSVWTVRYGAGELVRINPSTSRIRRIKVGRGPFDLLFASGSVWVSIHDEGLLAQVDPKVNRVAVWLRLERGTAGLAYAGNSIWVGSTAPSTKIFRVDPRAHRMTAIDVGHAAPAWFTTGAGSLWVTTHDGPGELGGMLKLDPVSGAARAYVAFDGNAVQPAFGPEGTIWVPGKAFNIVTRVDPATTKVVDVFPAGPGAYNALRAFGDMWVTSYAGTDIWRFRAG